LVAYLNEGTEISLDSLNIFICALKMNEILMGLKRHGWANDRIFVL